MTSPTQGEHAKTALQPIQRFEVVDCIDSKHVPAVIPNASGPWVRYEDHAAALHRLHAENEALRTTPVQNPAENEHVAGDVSKNGAGSNMSTQQPAPATQQAASSAVLRAIREANMQLVRTGDDEFMLVTYKNAKAQCDGGKCGIGGYCDDCPTPQADSAQDEPLQAFDSPRAKALMRAWEEGWAACRDAEYVGEEAQNDAFNSSHTLTLCIAEDQQLPAPQADSQPAHQWDTGYPPLPRPDLYDSAAGTVGWSESALQGFVDADRAARAPADSVTAPAAYSGNLEQELAMLIRRIVSSARRNCEDGSNVLKLANEAWAYLVRKGLNGSPLRDAGIETAPTPPAQAADSVLEDAARLERERICAAIKAEDDYCIDQGDYMLDSDDCIKIVRGEWVRPDFAVDAARKKGANHDHT